MDRSRVGTRTPRVYTKEMQQWILDNADTGVFKSQKNFTDVFNAIHGTSISYQAMNTHLHRYGIIVKTKHNSSYTKEMDNWLIDNYSKYDNDWIALAHDFNLNFGTDYSNCRLAKHCQRGLKIHTPAKKVSHKYERVDFKTIRNKGQFIKGQRSLATDKQAPIGTIRTYTSHTSKILYVKVKLTDGESGILSGKGHNYRRPWWIPLKEKVWIDAHGEIPEGYRVIQLDRDYKNCDLDNLALADKRGLAIMMSHKWWTDSSKFNATGVQWCNLYMTAKDNNVL